MQFRALIATGGAAEPSTAKTLGNWNASRPLTITTETGDVGNGAVVSAMGDLSQNGANLSAGSGDRPVLDTLTQAGLTLVSYDSDDRLSATVADTVRTMVIVFRVPASPAPRVFAARDTSATTTKPAFNIGLTA